GIRIHYLKAAPGESIAKIESRAAQIFSAVIVDEKLNAGALDNRIALFLFVERHLIMHPRATALVDLHAQPFARALLLRVEQTAEVPRRVLGDVHHRLKNYRSRLLKSKR